MSGGRIIGDADSTLTKPPNLEAVGAVMLGYTPPGDGIPSTIRGVRVNEDGHIIVSLGGGSGTVVEGSLTLSDAVANPTNAIPAGAFVMGYDRAADNWERIDRYNLTLGGAGTNVADSGAALKSAAHLIAHNPDTNQWVPLRTNASGWVYTYAQNAYSIGDARAVLAQGVGIGNVYSFAAHRDQANNSWYMTRGGYIGVIAAASVPGIVNGISTLARKTTAPAPADGELVAAQASARGAVLVLPRLPDPTNDVADLPLPLFQVGVDQSGSSAAPTVVYSAFGTNGSGGDLYLGIYSKATPLSSGVDVPRLAILVPTGQQGVIGQDYLTQRGIRCAAGLIVAWSTRPNDYTAPAAATGLTVGAVYNT